MVPDCSTSAENDGEHRGLFSASSDRVEVAGHQLGPVSAVPEGGVEAENVDAGQYEQEVLQRREDIVQPFDLARIYQEMNEPEEGDYGWTTLMDEDTRIEDVLTLWNKDVDNLVVFVGLFFAVLTAFVLYP